MQNSLTSKIRKRRANMLYQIRKKGYKCQTKEKTIFFPYGENPNAILQIQHLISEFNFTVQYQM